LEHVICSIIYGIILPIDQYVSRLLKPPTRIQWMWFDQQLFGKFWFMGS
jgi:hypothetical protein